MELWTEMNNYRFVSSITIKKYIMNTATSYLPSKTERVTGSVTDAVQKQRLKKALFEGISTGQLTVSNESAALTPHATPAFITNIAIALHESVILHPAISVHNLTGDSVFIKSDHFPSVHELLEQMAKANKIIDEKYSHVQAVLGNPVSTLEFGAHDGFYRTYERGAIYLSPKGRVFEVHGAIYQRYVSLKAEAGVLGYPQTDETATSLGTGKFNHFDNGSIFWSPATGAWEIQGLIRDKWLTLSAERGFLGFPTSNEENYNGSQGRISNFQRGVIIYLWGDAGANAFPDAVIFKKDKDESGVACHAELWMNSKGDWRHTGHLHNKNALGELIRIATNPRFQDAAGNMFYVPVTRHPAGAITFGSSTDDWDQTGSGEQFIIDNWDALKYAGIDVHINAKITLGDIVQEIFAGAVIGIGRLIEGFAEDWKICGPYEEERRDPDTGEQGSGISFQVVDKDQPCPRGNA
jgi:hypothetical protein